MASITKRCRHPRTSWDDCRCSWYLRQQVAGRVQYQRLGSDRRAAERVLSRLDAAPQETVVQAVDAWLAAKERQPDARPNSLHAYRSRSKHVVSYFGQTPVAALRPADLTRFVDDLIATGVRPATVRGVYALLTAVLRHALRRGLIRHLVIPPDGPGIPTSNARSHALGLDEVEAVIARLTGVWRLVAELVLLTGLRWGEAVAIEPGDIDGHVLRVRRTRNRAGGVNAPKTLRGERVVPLSPRAQRILHELELPVGGDYRRAYEALVHAMGELHRPGMGWHTLRAAHAALLDAAGITLRDQAARMGHGTHFAQTLQYGLVSQAGTADVIDAARHHVASAEASTPGVVPLDAARARRRRAP